MTVQARQTIANALTFDVEDYFHVSNFESRIRREDWDSFDSRVESNTYQILEILAGNGIQATFFVLGWVAERFPKLLREIAAAGHELGTHSHGHRLIYDLTPEQFRADLRQSIDIIEQTGGHRVLGHRAPSFSVTQASAWALDIMQQEGLEYDSSIFPIRHHRYGWPASPRCPYEVRSGFWEVPMATVRIAGRNLPIAGGGYLRLYPYTLTRWGIGAVNRESLPVVVYVHPWELDPEQPRIQAPWLSRFRHYNNLGRTAPRLRHLCEEFQFTTVRKVLGL